MFKGLFAAWKWLTSGFVNHIQDADKVAVTITEFIKTLLANPEVNFLVNLADTVTSTQIPSEIAAAINALIPKILAVELGIQGLPASPTETQILAFEQSIMTAFSVKANNSKLYTELSSQIYGLIQVKEATGDTKFAGWVDAIEKAYFDLQKDIAANAVPIIPASTLTAPAQTGVAESEVAE